MLTTLPPRPIIIGHRGCCGLRPEHTLASYSLAIEQGADYIEPDLVITKDGALIARHENLLNDTTDVATKPEFASRQRAKTIDGVTSIGWYAEDFTLAEIKTLRTKERLPQLRPENTHFDGQDEILTFDEILAFVRKEEKARGRTIGVYPETKHPSYFRKLGLPIEEPMLKTLAKYGYSRRSDWIFIQSFEVENLRSLRRQTRLKLIQLVSSTGKPVDGNTDFRDMVKPAGLKQIKQYADGIGVEKSLLLTDWKPNDLVKDAHDSGLLVHAWTFRDEDMFQPPFTKGKPVAEYHLGFDLGLDGVFTDFPGTASRALASWVPKD